MEETINENYEYLEEPQMMLEQPAGGAVEGRVGERQEPQPLEEEPVEPLDQGEEGEEEEEEEEEDQDMMGESVFANVGQGLQGHYRNMMMAYWQETINSIEHEEHDFKNHQLPLARIKKVMKTDEEVRMISAEAPILFAKGCDIFITELTMRAWIHAEENKRRTLQRSDIAAALQKSDMFDFLIDIVPREDDRQQQKRQESTTAPPTSAHFYEGERPFAPERPGEHEFQYENYDESQRF